MLIEGGAIGGVRTTLGEIRAPKVGLAVAGQAVAAAMPASPAPTTTVSTRCRSGKALPAREVGSLMRPRHGAKLKRRRRTRAGFPSAATG